jgi:hypothetical protein
MPPAPPLQKNRSGFTEVAIVQRVVYDAANETHWQACAAFCGSSIKFGGSKVILGFIGQAVGAPGRFSCA